MEKQIGTDSEKLKRNSPRLHAAEFTVPVLMLHGNMDAQVPFEQSTDMDDALKRAGKPHRLVEFPDGDHQFGAEKDRAKLLHEIESFLGEHLGPGTTSVP
jgi:dipeptidyl aminopeptidase/acylaminoacyl peptidase